MIMVHINSVEECFAVIDKVLGDHQCAIAFALGILIVDSKKLAAEVFANIVTGISAALGEESLPVFWARDIRGFPCVAVALATANSVLLYGLTEKEALEFICLQKVN